MPPLLREARAEEEAVRFPGCRREGLRAARPRVSPRARGRDRGAGGRDARTGSGGRCSRDVRGLPEPDRAGTCLCRGRRPRSSFGLRGNLGSRRERRDDLRASGYRERSRGLRSGSGHARRDGVRVPVRERRGSGTVNGVDGKRSGRSHADGCAPSRRPAAPGRSCRPRSQPGREEAEWSLFSSSSGC